jgi:hypothetical protein
MNVCRPGLALARASYWGATMPPPQQQRHC